MSAEKTEALRLARELEACPTINYKAHAAELRRLYKENESLRQIAQNFPPLPPSPVEVGDLILQTREHVQALGWGNREQLYTASQVRAVIAAIVLGVAG